MKVCNLKIIVTLFFSAFILFNACDSTQPDQTSLSLSFATETTVPKLISTNEEFQIEEVKLLIRNIKIKNQSEEDSLQVKTGPIVVNLNLDGKLTEFAATEIPAGNYNRVRFEIHKIEDSEVPPDAEFKEGLESSKRYSVIVKGLLNGETFTYKSRKSAVQDVKLETDIIVEENEDANLTINVNPYSWFYDESQFLNPNETSNESKIDNNLQYAFKNAYKDNDHDGVSD